MIFLIGLYLHTDTHRESENTNQRVEKSAIWCNKKRNTKIWHWQIKFINLWGRERTFPLFFSCCVNITCACVLTSVLQVGFTSTRIWISVEISPNFRWKQHKISKNILVNPSIYYIIFQLIKKAKICKMDKFTILIL